MLAEIQASKKEAPLTTDPHSMTYQVFRTLQPVKPEIIGIGRRRGLSDLLMDSESDGYLWHCSGIIAEAHDTCVDLERRIRPWIEHQLDRGSSGSAENVLRHLRTLSSVTQDVIGGRGFCEFMKEWIRTYDGNTEVSDYLQPQTSEDGEAIAFTLLGLIAHSDSRRLKVTVELRSRSIKDGDVLLANLVKRRLIWIAHRFGRIWPYGEAEEAAQAYIAEWYQRDEFDPCFVWHDHLHRLYRAIKNIEIAVNRQQGNSLAEITIERKEILARLGAFHRAIDNFLNSTSLMDVLLAWLDSVAGFRDASAFLQRYHRRLPPWRQPLAPGNEGLTIHNRGGICEIDLIWALIRFCGTFCQQWRETGQLPDHLRIAPEYLDAVTANGLEHYQSNVPDDVVWHFDTAAALIDGSGRIDSGGIITRLSFQQIGRDKGVNVETVRRRVGRLLIYMHDSGFFLPDSEA